jgi:hypothetical protein
MKPYIMSVHEDPELSGALMIPLPEGERVMIGNSPFSDIHVLGPGSVPLCCSIVNIDNDQV